MLFFFICVQYLYVNNIYIVFVLKILLSYVMMYINFIKAVYK